MTEQEGDRWIALAMLHGYSTVGDIHITEEPGTYTGNARGTHDPMTKTDDDYWWVYRTGCCYDNFATRAEAARHYCKHYGIEP